jgi:outer membrane protein assembly factor BamD
VKLYPDKSVAPDALYFLAQTYHDLGADDWASEQLTLLAEKYPDSAHSSEGKRLLAKIGKEKPTTVLAKKPEPTPSSSSPTASPSESQLSLAAGTPSVPTGSFRLPSATALSQSFVSCRLGAWC